MVKSNCYYWTTYKTDGQTDSHSNPLRHNIYSTIYRLISLYISDWSPVFLELSWFVHFLFTRFKISLSLHLYNINSTVSYGPAASLEASRWDSSFLICLDFTLRVTSLSHRAANLQKGSNMHQKSWCGFVRAVGWRFDGSHISPTIERSFTLQHHNRAYKQNHRIGTLLRACKRKGKK